MGIGVVGIGSAKGIVFKVSDKDAVYGADKDTGIGEPCGDRLVVPFGVFHTAFCFHVKIPKQFNQIINCGLGVGDIAGRHDYSVIGPEDCDSAFTFENINTNSIHNRHSFKMY